MTDNSTKYENDSNLTYQRYPGTMHPMMTNMSVVPQISTRPTSLTINNQHLNNTMLFTPNQQDKFSLSTPELINALATPSFNNGQPSPGTKVFDEMFNMPMNNINQQYSSVQPSMHPVHPNMHPFVSNAVHQKPESIPTHRMNRTNSQISSSRHRSISSSMNENDSSNSTAPSSPTGSYTYSNHIKDELQHVPSMKTGHSGEPNDAVKKERKRERNRQAAQKCRTRKLTRIAELQKRVNDLQGKNKDLTGIAESLKTDINKLEKQLQDHHTQGCTLINGALL
ncbi:hypothetical protein I4U23_025837 [Adineta vaga]|nr:hypothetical protein I4U23_025837 [Adineta vaga]